MKTRHLLTIALLWVFSTVTAQWNVSTEVSNKKVLVEEYTGIHCGYCPQAHKIVAEMIKAQGDNVYAVAIHAGSYAVPGSDEPDFRISEGVELNNHFDISGYPAGMVNRQRFMEEYPSPVCNRDLWATFARMECQEAALVNLWMSSSYNPDNRQLTVDVEGYYTDDVDANENFLTVVVTENNIMGPQSGSGVGSEYMHQHMARAYLTPALGESITNCRKGEYFSRQYIYDVPETINGVAVNPAELEVVAFVCESDENVLNVTASRPDYPGLELPLAAEIAEPLIPIGEVYGYNFFDVMLTNKSTEDITTATFTITFNNVDYEIAWSGSAPARATTMVRLPFDIAPVLKETSNKYTIKLTGLNGIDYAGNKLNGRFNAPYDITPTIKVELMTDVFADENRFLIKDAEGNVVTEIGPFAQGMMESVSQIIELQPNTTYSFEINDAWSNGLMEGFYKLYDANNQLICQEDLIEGHGCFTFFTTGERNVSTEKQTKCVLIEEFTGIHCGNCPDAHLIIEELMKAQGDIIYPLAYHAGHYAIPAPSQPDFRTAYGDSLDIYFVPDGYPNGMINRYLFDGENTLMLSRGVWSEYSHLIADQEAPVNLWVGSQYDSSTGELTVYVEGYYTADVDAVTNMLNVVVTQNNILGPQSGTSAGNAYVHNHVVRATLTPMWGDTIDGCRNGDFFKRKYTYKVPEYINGVATNPADFEVVAFVCNDKDNVLNVTGKRPDYPGLVLPMDAEIKEPLITINGTYGYNYYEVLLVNNSTEDIVEAGFDITLNNELHLTEWRGIAPARETTLIAVPFNQSTLMRNNNDFVIRLGGVNYKLYDGNTISGEFQDPHNTTPTNKFVIKTGNRADENKYLIKDADGNVVHEFGPFPVGVISEVTEEVTLDADQVYCLEITDSWGNGILNPRGTCKMYNADGRLVAQQLEIQGHGCRIFFATTENAALSSIENESNVDVSYDVAHRCIRVDVAQEPCNVFIYNAAGQCVYQAATTQSLSVPAVINGVYLVKIATNNSQQVFKVAVH